MDSFLGDPSIPSSEGKGSNSYPRSRFMADELRFWLNKLVEGQPGMMYVRDVCLASGSGIRVDP